MSEAGLVQAPNPTGPGDPGTSGTYTYNQVATQLITNALRDIDVINDEEVPTAGMFATGLTKLNGIVKALEATGIHVWTEEEGILFCQKGQYRYLLGPGSTDNYTDAFSYQPNSLGTSAPAGSMSVTVSVPNVPLPSTKQILPGDNFGVVLDNGFIFWSIVAPAGPSGLVVPLTTALPSSASAQNFCFDYTSRIVRPLKIPSARRLQYQGYLETPFTGMYSREDYMTLPNKTTPGTITQAFYTPKRSVGELYLWPNPIDANAGVRFTWYRPIQDFNSVCDQPDLPQEWVLPLEWQLAFELTSNYSVPQDTYQRAQMMSAQYRDLVLSWDRESEDIQFTIAYDGVDHP